LRKLKQYLISHIPSDYSKVFFKTLFSPENVSNPSFIYPVSASPRIGINKKEAKEFSKITNMQ